MRLHWLACAHHLIWRCVAHFTPRCFRFSHTHSRTHSMNIPTQHFNCVIAPFCYLYNLHLFAHFSRFASFFHPARNRTTRHTLHGTARFGSERNCLIGLCCGVYVSNENLDQIIWSMWLIVSINVRFSYSNDNGYSYEPFAGITWMWIYT